MSSSLTIDTQAFGDRLRFIGRIRDLLQNLGTGNLVEFIGVIRDFDLSRIGELVSAFRDIGESENLKEKVTASLHFAKIAVEITPTDVDNQIVEFIDRILTDQILDVILPIIESLLASSISATAVEAHEAPNEIVAQAVNWPMLLQIIKLIVGFLI